MVILDIFIKLVKVGLKIAIGAYCAKLFLQWKRKRAAKKPIDVFVNELPWQPADTYILPHSKSYLTVPQGHAVVFGDDAKTLLLKLGYTNQAHTVEKEPIEAVVTDQKMNFIYYSGYPNEGYISFDTWDMLDFDKCLAARATEAKALFSPLQVLQWRKKPTLDEAQATVVWAYELQDEIVQQSFVNATSLRFSSRGYEEINWTGVLPADQSIDDLLQSLSETIHFAAEDIEEQYGPFPDGCSIATLVNAMMGIKQEPLTYKYYSK